MKSRIPPTGPQAVLRAAPPQPAFSKPARPSSSGSEVAPSGAVPLGPRVTTTTTATSPRTFAANIPTGPRADRAQATVPRGPMQDRSVFPSPRQPVHKNLQWVNRQQVPGGSSFPDRPFSNVPAKRGFNGEKKERSVPPEDRGSELYPAARRGSAPTLDSMQLNEQFANRSATLGMTSSDSLSKQNDPTKATTPSAIMTQGVKVDSTTIERAPQSAISSTGATNVGDELSEDEDGLGLDEADFEESEAKFLKEKKLLEAKLVDLSDRSLRASTPLEEIDRLLAIHSEDLSLVIPADRVDISDPMDTEVEPIKPTLELTKPDVLTSKAEEDEGLDNDDSIMEDETRRSPSLSDREMSLEIEKLPFLGQGPPTPLSDPDHEKPGRYTKAVTEGVRNQIRSMIEVKKNEAQAIEEEFAAYYSRWRQYIDAKDAEFTQTDKDQHTYTEPVPTGTTPEPPVPSALPTPDLRRTNRFASEYLMEQVLKESRQAAEEQQAKQEREAKKAKPDMEKEAEIPPLMSPAEQKRRRFVDTSRLRNPASALAVFHFEPPEDDFTEEEHARLVANYHTHPKKWGQLASLLGTGRTYKECINHYYSTKWAKEYKAKTGRRRPPKRPRATAGRGRAAAAAALEVNRPELFGADGTTPVIAVTDSGRPRRAAAPTFGDRLEAEADAATPTPTSGKGRAAPGEPGQEKAKRARTTKEKGTRKGKTALVPVPAVASPVKPALEVKDRIAGVKQEDGITLQPIQMIPDQHAVSIEEPPSREASIAPVPMGEKAKAHAPGARAGPSSYWSVLEQNDFRRNIAYFGTDFQAIANNMGTKTMTMVRASPSAEHSPLLILS